MEAAQVKARLAEQDALLQAFRRVADGDLDSPIEVAADSCSSLWQMRSIVCAKMSARDLKQLSTKTAAKQLNDELCRQIEQRSRRLLNLMIQRPQDQRTEPAQSSVVASEHYRIVCMPGTGASGVVLEVERITDGKRLLPPRCFTKCARSDWVVRFCAKHRFCRDWIIPTGIDSRRRHHRRRCALPGDGTGRSDRRCASSGIGIAIAGLRCKRLQIADALKSDSRWRNHPSRSSAQ